MRITKEQEEIRNKQIERWQQSGLSQKEFCRQENISYGTFHYWHKQYKKNNYQESNTDNFINLTSDAYENNKDITGTEIVFPSGIRIIFKEMPSVQYLINLIR